MSLDKYTSEQIESAKNKMVLISDYTARNQAGRSMEQWISDQSFTKDEYMICLVHGFERSDHYIMEYVRSALALAFANEYPDDLDYIIDNTVHSNLKIYLLSRGQYNDISIIDSLCSDKESSVRLWACQNCSIEALRLMTNDSSPKVRRAVFARLGPVESLDEMLSDKDAQIRQSGVLFAPMNYEGLSNMCGELSKKVFPWIVRKINKDKLPMLLGNRNMKVRGVKSLLSERMNRQ